MGASKKIKKILVDKGMTQVELAKAIGERDNKPPKDVQQIRNALSRDTFTYAILEHWLDILGCDIVFRDRETGKLYD